jgi:site-specific recombinase XerC
MPPPWRGQLTPKRNLAARRLSGARSGDANNSLGCCVKLYVNQKPVKPGPLGTRGHAIDLLGRRIVTFGRDSEWSQVEFGRSACLHVRRVKSGKPSIHPLRGDEVRALRELRRHFPDSAFVFATERGGPFTTDAVNRLIKRIGERAGSDFPVHAHMLRHGCGYALANAGHDTRAIQDWLGHRSIQHTVRYTELSPARFKEFWR